MKIPVIWKSYKEETPNRGYWDYGMIEAILSRDLWHPVSAYEFEHYNDFGPHFASDDEGAVIIIPARHHIDKVGEINHDIAGLKWCIIILIGDEEAKFPSEKLYHPNMKLWVMDPHMDSHKNADRYIVNGWPPQAREELKKYSWDMPRPLNSFISAQNTHKRRKDCFKAMREVIDGMFVETEGFTQGVPHSEYFRLLAMSKTAPCPSGPQIPDSFRFAEALEAGCLPIVDELSPKIDKRGYWNILFGEGELPFPLISDVEDQEWDDLPGIIQYYSDTYPQYQNICFAWWQAYKRSLVYNLEDDIRELSNIHGLHDPVNDRVTILMPTSPIHTHPDTNIIEETIGSIRERLPKAEIIIMFDGIREEQSQKSADYHEYVRRILWKCNFYWNNVLPMIFKTHQHQVAMTREALKLVRTPTIMFVEHDTPLCEDIPFSNIIETVVEGTANVVRLNHEALILEEHKHLTLDSEPQIINNIPLVRTAQWSQRPHIARTDFYIDMLNKHFHDDARSMIEDGIHGHVQMDYQTRKKSGWNDWKLWLYAPEGDMKRSYHNDGRQQESKFDDTFKY